MSIDTKPYVDKKDGSLFVSTYDGHLISLDPEKGKIIRDINMEDEDTAHFMPNGNIYIYGEDSIKVITREGKEIFSVPIECENTGIQTIDSFGNALLYTGTGVSSLSPRGKTNWKSRNYGIKYFPSDPSRAYTMTDSTIMARDAKTGKRIWSKRGEDPVIISASHNRTVVNFENTLKCFDSQTGDELWEREIESFDPQYDPGPDGSVFVTENNRVRMLDPNTGKTKWEVESFDQYDIINHKIAAENGILYMSSGKQVEGIDMKTGKKKIEYKSDDTIGKLNYDHISCLLYISSSTSMKAYDTLTPEERLERMEQSPDNSKKLVIEEEYIEIGGVRVKKQKR